VTERFERRGDGSRFVPLALPIDGHKGKVTAVVLRMPTWPDYQAIGDIQIPARQGESVTLIDDVEAIGRYAERLVVGEAADFLPQLKLPDVLAVHEAIKDFFQQARSGDRPSTSSSASAGAPPTSGT